MRFHPKRGINLVITEAVMRERVAVNKQILDTGYSMLVKDTFFSEDFQEC